MFKEIEMWADSFHEGSWACEHIVKYFQEKEYKVELSHEQGFIPVYYLTNSNNKFKLIVYGSYKTWSPLPRKIKELLSWGKPDFLAYDKSKDEILFAVEETAATPTGNQATQRCERQYGSSRKKIPYWYLVSEFGLHGDGGVRRDSIWPTLAAIKLTMHFRTPCVVLHYSDIDNVEDYQSGTGVENLFSILSHLIENHIDDIPLFDGTEKNLTIQYKEMTDFILSQWDRVIDYLPSKNILKEHNVARSLTRYALGVDTKEDNKTLDNFLEWPLIKDLPEEIRMKQEGKELIKHDDLAEILESHLTEGKAYVFSTNAGSGKPTRPNKIKEWVASQKLLFERGAPLDPPAYFTMSEDDFPLTQNGNKHMTTAKNIVYLYDRFFDLRTAIETSFPRLINKFSSDLDDRPVFLYLSNSLRPGRIFGDPYTGQLAAFSTIFGKFDSLKRLVIVYFPHQTYTQAINTEGIVTVNKGTTLMKELTDYIIFNSGVVVSLENGEIL